MDPTSVWRHHSSRILLILLAVLMLTPLAAIAAEIHGTVKNAEGGEPLGKIQVSIAETNFRVETAKDGRFQFSGIAVGNYTLRVNGLGYRGAAQTFSLTAPDESKEFEIFLVPDFFRRNEVVEVHGDVFEPSDWPAVGDLNLTSTELQQTSTVAVNDPYRSLQSLPGVSASANNDLLAQFSVMGAPYENVGVYVDDVRVPNLLHSIPGFPDAASLSLFTGNDVDELRLLPVAYPVRYAEDAGAALAITTRTGTEGPPTFHFSAGLVDVEGLAEGGFSPSHHGTWLISARKSFTGYLDQFIDSNSYSNVGIYDANLKVTYDLTPAHTLSFFATGGRTHISNPSIPTTDPPSTFKTGNNDLAIGRFGWRWQILRNLVLDSRAAYVRTGYQQNNPTGVILSRELDREWSGGTILSWSYSEGGVFQAGYSNRRPLINEESNFYVFVTGPPIHSYGEIAFHSQNAFAQASQQYWKGRLVLEGGLRWAKQRGMRVQPMTGQASASLRVLANTQLEASWGKYSQFASFGGIRECFGNGVDVACAIPLPYSSTQYLVAAEQKFGARTRFRVEVFDRQSNSRGDIYTLGPLTLVERSVPIAKDYSRGVQVLLQRRSENRLSGWVGYTLTFARERQNTISLPQFPTPILLGTLYGATTSDQRHNLNLFASYRLTPTIRLGVKNLLGSGFPVIPGEGPNFRLGAYERLDLRIDKSWQFSKWKLGLYGELLNATNHYNPVFSEFGTNSSGNGLVVVTSQGVPITPTVGVAFDF
jgi:Carboxypeptidase regulatory-like domain/TonB-dependent Receptor Plug Domain